MFLGDIMKNNNKSKGYNIAVNGAKGIVRILAYVLIILFIVYLGQMTYTLGYEVFDQKSLDAPEDAVTISVTVTEDMTVYEIGEMLKEKGLVEKPRVFWIQEKLSDYRDELKPGTYELTTAQPVDEMLAIMSRTNEEEEAE